jgi:hypothetical protein
MKQMKSCENLHNDHGLPAQLWIEFLFDLHVWRQL